MRVLKLKRSCPTCAYPIKVCQLHNGYTQFFLRSELPRGQPLQAVHGWVGLVRQRATHAVGQWREQHKAVDDARQQRPEQHVLQPAGQAADEVVEHDACRWEERTITLYCRFPHPHPYTHIWNIRGRSKRWFIHFNNFSIFHLSSQTFSKAIHTAFIVALTP